MYLSIWLILGQKIFIDLDPEKESRDFWLLLSYTEVVLVDHRPCGFPAFCAFGGTEVEAQVQRILWGKIS